MDDEEEFSNEEGEGQAKETVLTLDGQPIPIHLHRSLGTGGRRAMATKIQAAGGDPTAFEDEARVIICRNDQPIFRQLEFKYDHDRYKWVEPPSWVDHCIMTARYEHYLPGRTGKTKQPSNSRTPFTAEDDEHLVRLMALRIPFKESGGRIGNGVYKDMCAPERAERYPWAVRHPWQSWRDRYTKNQHIFDPRIAHAVKNDPDPPEPGEKGQYVIPRKRRRPMPLRYSVQYDPEKMEEEEEEEEEDQLNEEEEEGVIDKLQNVTNKRSRHSRGDRQAGERRQSVSPRRKQPRTHINHSDAEDDADIGMGRDKGKGKGRQVPTESAYEQQPEDDVNWANTEFPVMYDNNEPGPSQFFEEPAPPAPLAKVSKVAIAARPQKQIMAPPSRKASGPSSARPPVPPAASSSRTLADSQKTLVAPTQTQRVRDRTAAPPDTQATVVPTSSLRHVAPSSSPGPIIIPEPRRPPPPEDTAVAVIAGSEQDPAPVQAIARNTRARRPPEAEFVRLSPSVPLPGMKRRKRAPSQAPLPSVRGRESTQEEPVSPQVPASVSIRDEVQVEEILEPPEDDSQDPRAGGGEDSGESSSGESLDDDEATRMLRKANKEMVNQGARSLPRLSKGQNSLGTKAAIAPARNPNPNPPYIDISSRAASMRASRRVGAVLRPSSVNVRPRPTPDMDTNADVDATPKARPPPPGLTKAAKKTASRETRYSESDDLQSEGETRTETTESSFPAETTIARHYKVAQSPFTPAHGTMAGERVRSERSKRKGKGKERAR